MDASRLVFVSVKDAKPRRKIAVPVPDDYTWEQFLQQVQTKLKLAGIDSIFLVSSGEKVTRLDDLQDIDELHVIEGAAPAGASTALQNGSLVPETRAMSGQRASTSGLANGNSGDVVIAAEALPQAGGASPLYVSNSLEQGQAGASHHRMGVADVSGAAGGPGGADGEGDMGAKYAKRSSGVRRTLQRLLPGLFQPSLPVTTRDVKEDPRKATMEGSGGSVPRPARRRGRRGRALSLRNAVTLFMALAFLGVLLLLYSRLWPRLP